MTTLNAQVLSVLKSIRKAVQTGDTFQDLINMKPGNGLCAHVFRYTTDGLISTMRPAFKALGYDEEYPVEMAAGCINKEEADYLYQNCSANKTMYNVNTQCGKIRVQLLNELIEYYSEKELA